MSDYRPQWYVDELARLDYIDRLNQKPSDRTWGHPVDFVLAIALVAAVAALVLGVL